MLQIISSDSVKGVYLKRSEILKKLKVVSKIAVEKFLEIKDIRIFGSFAKGEETGLSGIDTLIISDYKDEEHLKINMKYFNFFQDNIPIGIDLLVVKPDELKKFKDSCSLIKN